MTRADPTANLPPARVEPDARRRIRRALADAGRRIAVLDDDPTGSQTVYGVDVVTVFEPDELAAGLSSAGSTCFILTNTRSLPEADAVELNSRIGRMLFELADRLEAPIDVVSRSDSTLRGHVIAEVHGRPPSGRSRAGEDRPGLRRRRRLAARGRGQLPGAAGSPGGSVGRLSQGEPDRHQPGQLVADPRRARAGAGHPGVDRPDVVGACFRPLKEGEAQFTGGRS
jgi:hypothetical protein